MHRLAVGNGIHGRWMWRWLFSILAAEMVGAAGVAVTMKKPEEAEDLDYFNFDLVCVGCPSYSWHPPNR